MMRNFISFHHSSITHRSAIYIGEEWGVGQQIPLDVCFEAKHRWWPFWSSTPTAAMAIWRSPTPFTTCLFPVCGSASIYLYILIISNIMSSVSLRKYLNFFTKNEIFFIQFLILYAYCIFYHSKALSCLIFQNNYYILLLHTANYISLHIYDANLIISFLRRALPQAMAHIQQGERPQLSNGVALMIVKKGQCPRLILKVSLYTGSWRSIA